MSHTSAIRAITGITPTWEVEYTIQPDEDEEGENSIGSAIALGIDEEQSVVICVVKRHDGRIRWIFEDEVKFLGMEVSS